MTDLRKAAEMALEALKEVNKLSVGEIAVCLPAEIDDAMEALRQALKQPEQEPLGGEWVPCVKLPVIVHVRNQRDGENHISTREGITPVLPEDLIMRGVAGEEYPIGRELFERTYTFDTAPPKREWVGLTEAERIDIIDDEITAPSTEHFALAQTIEAKLKEKNV